jgi:methylated-DNA-protein-cysteine methyltransferase related protein
MKLSEKNTVSALGEKDFFVLVYQVCREIPHGKVTSYGAIAKYLGAARGARMVGWAMNNAHGQKEFVPAHRVVNRNGQLTGKMHFPNPDEMEILLNKEGVKVKNNQIINFKDVFWDPSIELDF